MNLGLPSQRSLVTLSCRGVYPERNRRVQSLHCFGTEYLDTEYSIPKYSAPR